MNRENMKLVKLYRTITVMGVIRIEYRLTRTFGKTFAQLIIYALRILAGRVPLVIINYLPKSICSLFSSVSLENNSSEKRCFTWANRAVKSSFIGHRKVAFFIKAHYRFRVLDPDNFYNVINQELEQNQSNTELLNFYLTWSWHNNSQINHAKLIKKTIINLQKTDHLFNPKLPHYLTEHTTNMGHLGALFLYSNFYRNIESNRHIAIWPELSPNKYYLDELLKIIPFKIELMPGNPLSLKIPPNQIDTLSYSRVKEGSWRYESLTDLPIEQEFPEFVIQEDFKLKSSKELDYQTKIDLLKIGFDENKWFVCLHVKENKNGYYNGGESRDASVESYSQACSEIYNLGGQVIRMGGVNFPKLSENFAAIDYAHSPVKSEKIDYWLWANCKFWIGNSNGAAVAVIPFRKPRLLTNTWPINAIGPSSDFFLPKLIYNIQRRKILSPDEVIQNKLSRTMKKDLFTKQGLVLIDNTPELISEAVLDFHSRLGEVNNNSTYSELEDKIYSAMNLSLRTQKMQIPKCFKVHEESSLARLNRLI